MWTDPEGLDHIPDGHGDTSMCAYYDQMAHSNPECGYYTEAAEICRGQSRSVNLLLEAGMRFKSSAVTFDVYQSKTSERLRQRLIQSDMATRSRGRVDSAGCPCGDDIDQFHNDAFEYFAIPKVFYGGNLAPQGISPVPYDEGGMDLLDDIINKHRLLRK